MTTQDKKSPQVSDTENEGELAQTKYGQNADSANVGIPSPEQENRKKPNTASSKKKAALPHQNECKTAQQSPISGDDGILDPEACIMPGDCIKQEECAQQKISQRLGGRNAASGKTRSKKSSVKAAAAADDSELAKKVPNFDEHRGAGDKSAQNSEHSGQRSEISSKNKSSDQTDKGVMENCACAESPLKKAENARDNVIPETSGQNAGNSVQDAKSLAKKKSASSGKEGAVPSLKTQNAAEIISEKQNIAATSKSESPCIAASSKKTQDRESAEAAPQTGKKKTTKSPAHAKTADKSQSAGAGQEESNSKSSGNVAKNAKAEASCQHSIKRESENSTAKESKETAAEATSETRPQASGKKQTKHDAALSSGQAAKGTVKDDDSKIKGAVKKTDGNTDCESGSRIIKTEPAGGNLKNSSDARGHARQKNAATKLCQAPINQIKSAARDEAMSPLPGGARTSGESADAAEADKKFFGRSGGAAKAAAAGSDSPNMKDSAKTSRKNDEGINGNFGIGGNIKGTTAHARIPSYPPEDKGLPAASAEAIMNTQNDLIGEIRRKLALGDALFEEIIRPSLLSFAGYAHLLPASEHNHHNAAGGLWRHSLETASIALDAMETSPGFAPDMDLPPARRKQAEAAERVIAFAAALMHDAGKPASDMLVTADSGLVWDPFTENLDAFLERAGAKRYFVSYLPNRYKRHEYFASVLAGRFAPPPLMSWLSSISPETVRTLLFAIYPAEGYSRSQTKAALIAKTVKDADCASAARDLRRRLYVADDASVGIRPIEQALGIMRDLVSEGVWKTNAPGARLWHTRDGLFLAWSGGFADISQKLAESVPNICPALAADWLRLLGGSGIIEEHPSAIDGCIFLGRPEGVKSDKIRFVRFTDPRILLKDPLPEPVGIEYSGAKPLCAMQASGAKIAEDMLKGFAPEATSEKNTETAPASCDETSQPQAPENNFGRMLGRAFADKLRADNPDISIPLDFNGKEAKLFVQEIKKIRAEAAKETKAAVKEALKTQKKQSAVSDE